MSNKDRLCQACGQYVARAGVWVLDTDTDPVSGETYEWTSWVHDNGECDKGGEALTPQPPEPEAER